MEVASSSRKKSAKTEAQLDGFFICSVRNGCMTEQYNKQERSEVMKHELLLVYLACFILMLVLLVGSFPPAKLYFVALTHWIWS